MDVASIKKVFVENEVDLTKDDIWRVQQAWVIKHAALERLAAKLGIMFEEPVILQGPGVDNYDGSLAIMVRGYRVINEKRFHDWSIGEVNSTNYRTSGKQPAYPWAMTEKRAKDRVIIKLAGLHGLYSEDEADDFASQNKPAQSNEDQPARSRAPEIAKGRSDAPVKLEVVKPTEPDAAPDYNHLTEEQSAICARVLEINEIAQVSDYMMSPEVQAVLAGSNAEDRTFIRNFAARRLKALGWLGAKPGVKNAADA